MQILSLLSNVLREMVSGFQRSQREALILHKLPEKVMGTKDSASVFVMFFLLGVILLEYQTSRIIGGFYRILKVSSITMDLYTFLKITKQE